MIRNASKVYGHHFAVNMTDWPPVAEPCLGGCFVNQTELSKTYYRSPADWLVAYFRPVLVSVDM